MRLNAVVPKQLVANSVNRPLVYFWIAELKDGKAVAQFDPQSGTENRFALIDFPKLARFGWYPFTPKFAKHLYSQKGLIVIPTANPVYTVNLNKDVKLVASRENTIKIFWFYHCGNHVTPDRKECGHNWMFQANAPDPMIGLPYSLKANVEEFEVQDQSGKKKVQVINPICPKCGWHDHNGPDRHRKIRRYSDERRKIVYLLGVQGGRVLRIKEDGELE